MTTSKSELARLKAENARLTAELSKVSTAPRRSILRSIAATLLIVLGAVLAPIGVVTAWAGAELSDTERFVETLSPLAEDPEVQSYLGDQIAGAIEEALDPDSAVGTLLDFVVPAGDEVVPELIASQLQTVLADQVRAGIRLAVDEVATSDAFPTVWDGALRAVHSEFVVLMEGRGDGALTIRDDGELVLELRVLVDSLKPALVDAGFGLASAIPAVDKELVLAEIPGVTAARLAYSAVTTAGALIPWLSLALVAAGIAVSPRRSRAVAVAGGALVITAGALALGLNIGRGVLAQLLGTAMPAQVSQVIYDGITGVTHASAAALVLIGVFALAAGLIAGRSAGAARVRTAAAELFGSANRALVARRLVSARVPGVLRRSGWVFALVLIVIALVLFATVRPLTVSGVVITAVVAALASLVFAVLRGADAPAAEDSAAAPGKAPAESV